MKKLFKSVLKKTGINIKVTYEKNDKFPFLKDYNHKLGYDLEDEANNAIKKVRTNTMLAYERLVSLYQQAVFCEKNKIPGGFIECGVWKGGAVGLMALANLNTVSEKRHIHLFDAFDDICEPDPVKDGKKAIEEVDKLLGTQNDFSGKLQPLKGIYNQFGGYGSLNENKKLLEETIGYPKEYVHYHQGWFQETIPQDSKNIEQIAILRLDGDWYESIKVCLDYLYPKVVKGGFIIIDDYGFYEGCTKAVDEYLKNNRLNPFFHHINKGARYWIK